MTPRVLADWLANPAGTVSVPGTAPPPRALLAGSFNPMHAGHLALAAAAARHLGARVDFELSVTNVDKPPLAPADVLRRVRQFPTVGPVWLTAAPTFRQKADLFPGCAFVVGHDTADRLTDPRYADGTPAGRDAALGSLLDRGVRVVVGGRVDRYGVFRTWDLDAAGRAFRDLWVALTEADFRADVSSTALRARGMS